MMKFRIYYLRKLRPNGKWGFVEGGLAGFFILPIHSTSLNWMFASTYTSIGLYFWSAGKRHCWEFSRGEL